MTLQFTQDALLFMRVRGLLLLMWKDPSDDEQEEALEQEQDVYDAQLRRGQLGLRALSLVAKA